MNWFVAYLICLISFLILDGAFISLIARKVYRDELGNRLNDRPKIGPGSVLYLLFISAILLYGVWPLLHFFDHAPLSDNFMMVWLWGAGLGLISFATYGLTNKALVKDWPTKLALTDIAWGTVLAGTVTCIGYAILS